MISTSRPQKDTGENMTQHRQLGEDLIAEAEKRYGFRAGIAAIDEVLDGPS